MVKQIEVKGCSDIDHHAGYEARGITEHNHRLSGTNCTETTARCRLESARTFEIVDVRALFLDETVERVAWGEPDDRRLRVREVEHDHQRLADTET
eukprot:1627634-Rhodomonas_salina.5